MGANCSNISELGTNEHLQKLAGTEILSVNDPFWNQLLSFTFEVPTNSTDQHLLDEATSPLCKQFAINNCQTGNFGALIRVFLTRATELKASAQCENNIFAWQTYNALFIIRNICTYMVENLSEEVVLQQFGVVPPKHPERPEENIPLGEQLMKCAVEVLVDLPVLDFTYSLHLECVNTLLCLLAIQMFQPVRPTPTTLFTYMMTGKCAIHAPLLTKTLLMNYIKQETCPEKLLSTPGSHGTLYKFTTSIASSLWSVMTLGMGTKTVAFDPDSGIVLHRQSLSLLLVLANHCTNQDVTPNPYRQALFSFLDENEVMPPTHTTATFKLSLQDLYATLCQTLHDDQVTLLMYLLLHQNPHVRAFILSRTSHDQLVLPVLEVLYHVQHSNSHHVYMALIILLILTEDDDFNKEIHDVQLKHVSWFKERHMKEVSLGGLLVLILIRTIQFNMTRMKDKYLHTNCLAALANMSATFKNLHPYVAQRLVSLFSLLLKKHNKMVEAIRAAALSNPTSLPPDNMSDSSQDADFEYITGPSQVEELSVLEEVIRMVLEIVNSSLTHALSQNPNLIYTLLYQQELFHPFRNHPTFQDVIQNIDTVLSYFSSKLDNASKQISVPEVHAIITQGASQFKKDKLKKFPELKFKYVEEESPEEFFVPYIWSLVYTWTSIYFNPGRIQIFTVQTDLPEVE